MSVAKSSLKPILNSLLAPGYPLPLPKGIDVEDFTITEWEGYLEIEAVPKFVPSEFD